MAKPERQRKGYQGPENDEVARRAAYEQCKRRGHEEANQEYSEWGNPDSAGGFFWWYRCKWCGVLFRWGDRPLLEMDIPEPLPPRRDPSER